MRAAPVENRSSNMDKENIPMIRYRVRGSGRRTILFGNYAVVPETDVTAS